jgi:hypothetical protein
LYRSIKQPIMHINFLLINPDDTIKMVQERFNKLFPSMQISFFHDPKNSKKTDQSIVLCPESRLNEINSAFSNTAIEIRDGMRVTDLEKIIKSLGLHSQISCRIRDRRFPESSVSGWLLQDVYEMESPFLSDTFNKNTFAPSKWGSNIK